MVFINLIEAIIRICFIFSIYAYEDSEYLGGAINETIHLKIIYLFLFIWVLGIIVTTLDVIVEFISDFSLDMKIYECLCKKTILYTNAE